MKLKNSLKLLAIATTILLSNFIEAKSTKIHILQTSDIHSNTFGKDCNVFKLAKLVKQKRKEYGKENSLLIDCGDFIHGNFAASMTDGLSSMFLVKKLNYDVAVVGNHELDYDINQIISSSKKLGFDYYGANINDKKTKKNLFKSYKLFEKNGVKILVVALTVPDKGCYDFSRNYEFKNYESTLEQITQELKSKKITADVYVLAVHDGFHNYPQNRVYKVLKKYPFFNIVMGGHHHRLVPGIKTPNNGFYTETASHAKGFTDITIEYDKEKNKLLNISSKFIDVKKDSPEDSNLKAEHYEYLKKIYPSLEDQKFISISDNIRTNDLSKYNSSAINLIGAAITNAAKNDYAIVGQLKNKSVLEKGELDDFDLYMFFQYEDMIYKISLNFDEYQFILQKMIKSKHQTLNFYGLKTVVNKDGKIIEDIKLKDGTIWQKNPKKRLIFACNRFALTNWRNHYFSKIARKKEASATKIPLKVRQAIKNYLSTASNKKYIINKEEFIKVK